MIRWAGKVVVVTGASTGIGAAICVRLADEGMRVVGLARRSGLIDELKAKVKGKGSIRSRQCDVSKSEQIDEAFQWIKAEFGGIDVLVNNAGVFFPGHITDLEEQNPISDEQVNSLLDINVRATMLCTRRAVASMKARGIAGHVINISSIAGHYIPFSEFFNVYASTKYAVNAFTQSLLSEVTNTNSGIRVTSISPGLVDTPMVSSSSEKAKLPMLRPADVAGALIYALSTPPDVNINDIVITAVRDKRL